MTDLAVDNEKEESCSSTTRRSLEELAGRANEGLESASLEASRPTA